MESVQTEFERLQKIIATFDRLENSPELKRRFFSKRKKDGEYIKQEFIKMRFALNDWKTNVLNYAKARGVELVNSDDTDTQAPCRQKSSVQNDFEVLFAMISTLQAEISNFINSEFMNNLFAPFLLENKKTFYIFTKDAKTGKNEVPFDLEYLKECLKELCHE